jgi:hypothetical protein
MPQAVVAAPWFVPALLAAGTAAGTVGSAALQGRASNRSTRAQSDATNKALAFEQERESYNRGQRERSQELYRRQWEAWQSQRLGMLRRYGYNVGSGSGSSDVRSSRLTLGTLARRPATPAPSSARGSLASYGGWR